MKTILTFIFLLPHLLFAQSLEMPRDVRPFPFWEAAGVSSADSLLLRTIPYLGCDGRYTYKDVESSANREGSFVWAGAVDNWDGQSFAVVKTDYGYNFLNADGTLKMRDTFGMVILENRTTVAQWHLKRYLIRDRAGRYGLFDEDEGVLIPTSYDTFNVNAYFDYRYWLRKTGEGYVRYDDSSATQMPSPYVDYCSVDVNNPDGFSYHIDTYVTLADGAHFLWYSNDSLVNVQVDSLPRHRNQKIFDYTNQFFIWKGKALGPGGNERSLTGYDSPPRMRRLSLIGDSSGYGLTYGAGRDTLLPAVYDELRFEPESEVIFLRKGVKWGLSHFEDLKKPPLPTYDKLTFSHGLSDPDSGEITNFFWAEADGQLFYVDEKNHAYRCREAKKTSKE